MKLFKKPSTVAEVAADAATDQAPARTASWTGGHRLAARAASVGLFALIVLWPVVTATVFGGGSSTASSAGVKAVSSPRSVTEQSAGAIAAGFVGAWLSATSDDSTQLQRYADTSQLTLPTKPWVYRDLTVVSIGEKTAGGLLPVQVAADVEETSIQGSAPKTSWQVRYFAVTVQISGDAVATVGMPATVAGPVKPKNDPGLNYPTKLDSTSAAASTVSSFLAAYLTGSGDVSVYVTPKVQISAISPAPYSAVKVASVAVDAQPAVNPSDGTKLRLLAETQLVSATGQQLNADYALTLTARADRWEVTSIDPTPAQRTSTKSK